jgi:CheY-like chemotaxis protein
MTRVLVVDDEADSLTLVELYLLERGFDVQTADTASEAVALASQSPPDVLITDYFLHADSSGVDVIRLLRKKRAGLPAVVITGMSLSDVRAELGSLRNVRVLPKPLTLKALESALCDAAKGF